MNPTVITTGPGVIIATATASTNWRSLSQPYSFTTPPYRNGTMASPLPKTNAPAFVKYRNTCHSVWEDAEGTPLRSAASGSGATQAVTEELRSQRGGVFISQASTPAAR